MVNLRYPNRRGEIGDRLRQERQRLGMNQTDFGALANVSKTTQVNYESGERSPGADYLADVAEKVDVLYVITGKRAEQIRLGSLDETILLSILRAVEAWELERDETVDALVRARLVSVFYSHAVGSGGLEPEWMRQTFGMVK